LYGGRGGSAGAELDLTRERVRQLEAQALSRLAALRKLSSVAAA
jgi:DNA-directed RNA polymerase sigma subunit (sigma70/sigma32)